MVNFKVALAALLLLDSMPKAQAALRGNRLLVDPMDELQLIMRSTRMLKDNVNDGTKSIKQVKTNNPPTGNEPDVESSPPTALPTGSPTATPNVASSSSPSEAATDPPMTAPTSAPTSSPTAAPTMPPVPQPTSQPTLEPTSAPVDFDSSLFIICRPDGATILTRDEARGKTIICDARKESCREALAAVKASSDLQNFFACAGNLGEGAARRLFNRYAMNPNLVEQLKDVAASRTALITERTDEIKAACMTIGMSRSPPEASPCCQGSSGCVATAVSKESPAPFMTVALTACTGDEACKDMGLNPLILGSACTGVGACKEMNKNDVDPVTSGVTFVGTVSCTSAGSCEGVGHLSYGDVAIMDRSCLGSNACNAAGRRTAQFSAIRTQSHIDIGPNACVGSEACKDFHSTVNRVTGGKAMGSLSIGDRACSRRASCTEVGFSDAMLTDIIVPPSTCDSVDSCRGCMTVSSCNRDEVYLISDAEGACPKGGGSNQPTGEKVTDYCIGKDTLPTECPTFSPTPFPTPLASSNPSDLPSQLPSGLPSMQPSDVPSDIPSEVPSISQAPSERPSDLPSVQPSERPSDLPSSQPSDLPSAMPSSQPSDLPSQSPSDVPSQMPSAVLSERPSDIPSSMPSDSPSFIPTRTTAPSDRPSDQPSLEPTQQPSEGPSMAPTDSQAPSEASASPTAPPASFQAGCITNPQSFNQVIADVAGEVTCDEPTGPCADFVNGMNALPTRKANMVKSIFSCSDGKPPRAYPLSIVQQQFDKIRDDPVVTKAILTTVATKDIFTGDTNVLASACQYKDCCTGTSACTTSSLGAPMTVSEGSCKGDAACAGFSVFGIALESCNGARACLNLGKYSFRTSPENSGFRLIEPGACNGDNSCENLGRNVNGNIRIEKGACDGTNACLNLSNRPGQNRSPVVKNDVMLGPSACDGESACEDIHAGNNKFPGGVAINKNGCKGDNVCKGIANDNLSISDIVIEEGVCNADNGESCEDCVIAQPCTPASLTYTIDDASEDCPTASAGGCS